MEPVGMTNAWTRFVVPNRRRRIVTVHSATKLRRGSREKCSEGSERSSSVTIAFSWSTNSYCNEKADMLDRDSHPRNLRIEHNCYPSDETTAPQIANQEHRSCICVYDSGHGRAVTDEERHGAFQAGCVGPDYESAAARSLYALRHQHGNAGLGAARGRVERVISDPGANLYLG